ncbi:DUF222 domain-containing protein [Actinomycetospora sp.]|jgi:hypothetical protein|uniref:DUF222 domain-containing protein n=1 Tax=Actinomycetospora sp. TaxID=1872135 RepID=UPI002F41164B
MRRYEDGGSVWPAECSRLAALDLSSLSGPESVEVMRLAFAVSNWASSMFQRAMYEACRAEEGTTVRRELDRHSGLEAAAAFGWSTTMADRRLALAADLIERLPLVAAAMADGAVEPRKARVFSEVCQDMTEEHLRATCEQVLPEVQSLPVAALGARLVEVATALDSGWSDGRLARALHEARVTHGLNPSGSADLCGRDLAPDDAIRARAHLDALTVAVYRSIRRSGGAPPRRPFIRARVFCRLVDGSLTGLDDAVVIETVAAELLAETDDGHPDDGSGPFPDDDPGPYCPPPDDAPPDGGVPEGPPPDGSVPHDDSGPGSDDSGPPPNDAPPDAPDDDSGPGSDDASGPDGSPSDGSVPDGSDSAAPPVRPDDLDGGLPDPRPPEVFGSRLRQGIVEIRLRLTTLLGLDDLPGTAPTWGALGAAQARALALARPGGEWRMVLCDDDGRPVNVLLLRRRPANAPRHRRDGRDSTAIVELAVRTGDLIALDLADDDPFAALVREAQAALPGLPTLDDPEHPANSRADAHRRRPGAELRRWLCVRDRWCIGPACQGPAATAEIDHTRDWAHTGPTVAANNGVPCGAHHRAKSDRRWKLDQPQPGHFSWTSPAGVGYVTRARRVINPLPGPLVRGRTGARPTTARADFGRDPDDLRSPAPRPGRPPGRQRDHTRAYLLRSRGSPLHPVGTGPDDPPL